MAEPQESTIDSSQQSADPSTSVESTANAGTTTAAAAEAAVTDPAEVVASSNSGDDADKCFKVPQLPPPPKTSNDKDLLVEAVQSMQQGKRHMIVCDYKSAVPSFEIACQLLDSIYGAGKPECAEAYLHYGCSLFELSRLEEGIMNGVVNVDNQVSSDEEEGDEEEGEEETPANDNEDNEAEAKASSPEESAQNEDKVDIDLTQPSTSKGEASASCMVTTNGDKSDEDDEADGASNVEIAWEVLTTAKDIYEQLPELNKENQLNLAEALQKLGEISIEWENNDNAVHLLNQCLEHRKAVLESDDRLIALTYHFLGIAFSFKNDIDRANSCFESALDVIQMRIKHLKEATTDGLDEFEKDSRKSEISQLEDLVPELTAKIEDMKEQMQSQFKTLESMQKESEKEETKSVQPCQEKPVNNISHLIKRKKEADGDVVAENGNSEGSSVKKVRTEENNSSVVDSSENTAN